MKEIIYNIDGVAGRVITLTGLTGTFTKNNVLGIINKSQGDVLYTPMDWNLLTFAYSNGTMTLTLAESVAAITVGDKLLIKLYTDAEVVIPIDYAKEAAATANKETIMGGSQPDYEVSHLGAAFDGNLCCPVIEGDADYRIDTNGEYGTTVSGNITVGTIFKVTGEDDEDDNVFLAPAAMGDDAELLYIDGLSLSLGASGEWLTPHKGKLYKVTSLRILSNEQAEITLVIPTYEEVTEGRSVSDVYDKLDELDVHDENAKHLAEFFDITTDEDEEIATDDEIKAAIDNAWDAYFGSES